MRFVVGNALQRTRRQPSRNLAQALLTARRRASDLSGQQVIAKEFMFLRNKFFAAEILTDEALLNSDLGGGSTL